MSDIVVEGKILRWGNSFGIRIRKGDLEDSGLQPDEEVLVRIERQPGELGLSGLPTFQSGQETTAERHDAILGESRSERHVEADVEEGDDR